MVVGVEALITTSNGNYQFAFLFVGFVVPPLVWKTDIVYHCTHKFGIIVVKSNYTTILSSHYTKSFKINNFPVQLHFLTSFLCLPVRALQYQGHNYLFIYNSMLVSYVLIINKFVYSGEVIHTATLISV